MSTELRGPDDRYRLTVEAMTSADNETFTRSRTSTGISEGDGNYRVVVGNACSIVLRLGENGLTVRSVRLLGARQAQVRALVAAGSCAPEWLPTESAYQLFEGDRAEAAAFTERYIPLEGMAREQSWPDDGTTPLDRLAVAVGRSVARANSALVRSGAEAGIALVSSVTVRVAVQQTQVSRGRVMVTLARPGDGEAGQFVEFSMRTVPPAPPDETGDL